MYLPKIILSNILDNTGVMDMGRKSEQIVGCVFFANEGYMLISIAEGQLKLAVTSGKDTWTNRSSDSQKPGWKLIQPGAVCFRWSKM